MLLVGEGTRSTAANTARFLHYELDVLTGLQLPIVVSNLNQSRNAESSRMPAVLTGDYYTVSVSFQPKIIMYALDKYVPEFAENLKATDPKKGPYQYKASVYEKLGL